MRRGMAAIALVAAVVVAGCSEPASVAEGSSIAQVTVSLDQTRLEIVLDYCNEDFGVNVTESDDAVTIDVDDENRSPFKSRGGDCQDAVIRQLADVLGDRAVIDEETGAQISVQASVPLDDLDWPYDRSRISEQEYEGALADMVKCLMDEDPAVTAWVEQRLNYKWWSWTKAPDAAGTVSTSGIEHCEQLHLAPLR